MKVNFKHKILFLLVGLIAFADLISIPILNYFGNQAIVEQIGKQALAIAISSATSLDGDMLELVTSRSDESRPEYQILIKHIRKIRDANRMGGIPVKFIYTIHKSAQDSSVLQYGLDGEESVKDRSYPGDIVHGLSSAEVSFSHAHIHPTFRSDEWGTWLIARAPVRNSKGAIVALLGIDISKDNVVSEEGVYNRQWLTALGLQLTIVLIGALLIAREASIPLKRILSAISSIRSGESPIKVAVVSNDEFGHVARALEEMSEGLAEGSLVKSAFARYVSQQVADSILTKGAHPEIHGERRRVTVLFCDVRGFTTLAESLTPEEVVQILNAYFERMVNVIFKYHGTLDKFLGDGLMAVFGAPIEDNFQEENALKAALEMRKEVEELNSTFDGVSNTKLSIGIGINSGMAIVGNIGSSRRMEYTAIGDTVNLASRLESKTKELGVDLLISEYTYNAVRGAFPFKFERVGTIEVKGRKDEVTAYKVPDQV